MLVPPPPSDLTGPLSRWAGQVVSVVNAQPTMSYFSGLSPESVLTGAPGHIAINVVSGTTARRAWLKTGDPAAGASTTGWLPLTPSGGGIGGATLTFGTHLVSADTSYNGSVAATIATDATNLNAASTIVARDASGNFVAGTITASLAGNATTATTLATTRTIWGQNFDGSANVSGALSGATTGSFSGIVTSTQSGASISSGFYVNSTVPSYGWRVSGGAADEKVWDAFGSGATLSFRAVNDADSSAFTWMQASRTGISTVSVAFGGAVSVAGTATLGASPMKIGDVGHGSGWTGLAATAAFNTTDYALLQGSDGLNTFMNVKSGGTLAWRVNNSNVVFYNATNKFTFADSIRINTGASDTFLVTTAGALTTVSTATIGAATDPVQIGRLSGSTTYGAISFNGDLGDTTMMGIFGRTSGGILFLNSPGSTRLRISGSDYLTVGSSALTVASGVTLAAQAITGTTLGLTGATSGGTTLDLSGYIRQTGTSVEQDYKRTDGAADEKTWNWFPSTTSFSGRLLNDARSTGVNWLVVQRSAMTLVDTSLLAPNVYLGPNDSSTTGVSVHAKAGTGAGSQPSFNLFRGTAAGNQSRWILDGTTTYMQSVDGASTMQNVFYWGSDRKVTFQEAATFNNTISLPNSSRVDWATSSYIERSSNDLNYVTSNQHNFTGNVSLGASSLLLTGSIASTGSRVTKGWFTDLAVTNAISGGVTGNAGTATTLQTARTIWGQSFDGSANVSGALSGATTISASSTITSTVASGSNAFVMSTGARFYGDGGTANFIDNGIAAANTWRLVSNGSVALTVNASTVTTTGDLVVPSGKKLYWDGGGDSYEYEVSANIIERSIGSVLTDTKRASVQTTDATTTTVVAYTTATDTTGLVKMRLISRRTTGTVGERYSYVAYADYKNVSGTVTLDTPTVVYNGTHGTVTIVLDASGADVRIRVTGPGSTTINWYGELEVSLGPS